MVIPWTVRLCVRERPAVRFELTEQTRQAIDNYIREVGKKSGEFLFAGRQLGQSITTRQYARHLAGWLTSIGLDAIAIAEQADV
jgi:hypothetical protein